MQSLMDGIESWLTRTGWAVARGRPRPTDNPHASEHLLTLVSTQAPRGVAVEIDVRIYDRWVRWSFEEQLLGVTVRRAGRPGGAGPAAEAYLTGQEAQAGNYRQLSRVLSWFHDAHSGALWEERPQQGDWLPPEAWQAEQWGPQFGVEYRWAVCAEPLVMLRALPSQPDERKLQLLACACCRLLPLPMQHERNHLAVAAAERYAEGLAARREMKKFCKHSDLPWLAQLHALSLAHRAAVALVEARPREGPRLAADVVRDVIGNPYGPVLLRHSWLRHNGGMVRRVAAAIAAERRYDELPILGDALEDAGCTDSAVLEHCRGQAAHVFGCWVLDLLLPRDRGGRTGRRRA